MCLGTVLMAIGAGLFTTFRVDTPTTLWVLFEIIFALGIGFGFQQPIIATQTNFSGNKLPTALTIVSFIQNLGGIVALSSAQNVFTNQLVYNLRQIAPEIDASLIQESGILNLRHSLSEDDVRKILPAYNLSITRTFLVSAVMCCITAIGCLGIPMSSVKDKVLDESRS